MHSDISAKSQRQRILAFLVQGNELTTHDARISLDVLAPAARIHELRQKGFNIITHWDVVDTGNGNIHRIAKYVLFPGTYCWPSAA